MSEQVEYWKTQLQDIEPVAYLADRPRNAGSSSRAGIVRFSLPACVATDLTALASQEEVTLFMLLLAAFQTLLHRWSGQVDISVGTPISGRTHRQFEAVVGCFLNTIVMRADLRANPSFRQALRAVKETVLSAHANQEVPFEKLVEELQPPREPAMHPLFQIAFTWLNASPVTLSLSGLQWQIVESEPSDAKFDLHLTLQQGNDGFSGSLEYRADLYEDSTARRLVEHLQVLLRDIVQRPDCRLSQLELLPEWEKSAQRVSLASELAEPRLNLQQSLVEAFETQAQRSANHLALDDGTATWSYAQLNHKANAVANSVLERAPKQTKTVAILAGHGRSAIAAMLGILKAGKAYVPLDPANPPERLRAIVADAGATLLCADAENVATAEQCFGPPQVLRLETLGDAAANPRIARAPDATSYILYTSGSTGAPKGVVQQDRNVIHFIDAYAQALRLTAEDRLTLIPSYAFDAAVMDIFGALLTGASLHLWDVKRNGFEGVGAWIERQAVTVWHSTPTVYRATAEVITGHVSTKVRLVVLGGEEVRAEDAALLSASFGPNAVLINGYGPTESTVTLQHHVDRQARLSAGRVPIGRPVARTSVLLLDNDGEPTQLTGELAIRSDHLALGYLGDERLTSRVFLDRPRYGGRLYRTGDQVRYRADGQLEFLCRRDQQVKVRGVRIELGEIEACLRQQTGVAAAAVVVHAPSPSETYIAAYVVPSASQTLREDEQAVFLAQLREAAERMLPRYMVPARFVLLPRLPLLVNGKLDRRALPVPAPLTKTFQTPETPTENALSLIWRDVLNVERVGRHDRFFELGGHSLLAMQVVSRIKTSLGVLLPVRAMFEATDLAALAQEIERTRHSARGQRVVPKLVKANRDRRIPLSHAQQRLWFLWQLEPESAVYNISNAVRITGPLVLTAVQSAFDTLIQRHEALRTTFKEAAGERWQEIETARPLHMTVVDISGLSERQIQAQVAAESRRAFDLTQGPLLRVALFRSAAQEHILLVTLHHIVCDGWSMRLLLDEFLQLYADYRDGKTPSLDAPQLQYADYAVWQRNWLESGELDRQMDYWRSLLRRVPTEVPLSFDEPPARSEGDAVGSYRFSAPAALAPRLREFAQRHGISNFMLLLAGWSLALRQWSGVAHFRVGTDIANRNHQASEGIVGFFVNQLAIAVSVTNELTIRSFLEQVRDGVLDAFEHQDAPFDQVVQAVRPGGRAGRAPLYAVKFIHRDVSQSARSLAGCTLEEFPIERSAAEIELLLKSTATNERIDFELEYASGLFQERSMARVSRMLIWMLEALVTEADQSIDRLLLQAEAQEERWRVADAKQRSGRLPGLRRGDARSGEDTKVAL